jgi:hypothetical protein
MGTFFALIKGRKVVLMLISFLLTSVGFVFAHRILATSLKKIGYLNHHPRVFVILAGFVLFFFITMGSRPTLLWLLIGTILILLKSLPAFFSQYQEFLVQKNTLRILDHLVLGVQSGQSLRTSLQVLSARESSLLRIPMQNLVHAVTLENSSASLESPTLKKLYEELSRIEKSQSKFAEQLRALRRQTKTLKDFRRRSGQVTMQIRMQALVSAVLYVALLVFIIAQFGFFENRRLILASALLFFGGLVTVFVIGRRNRWNT